MTPKEAFRLINKTMPEELRGEDVDEAFQVLYGAVSAGEEDEEEA